jgi:hypothetical protein
MTRNPLYFFPGDDETRSFEYLDDDSGAVVSLSGYTATCTATVGSKTFTVTCTVNEDDGLVTATFSSAQTTSLGGETEKIGNYEVTATSAGGKKTTIAAGFVAILAL